MSHRSSGFPSSLVEALRPAYDVETKLLGLTLTERDEILRALEDAPAGLATFRGHLLRDRERWVRDGPA